MNKKEFANEIKETIHMITKEYIEYIEATIFDPDADWSNWSNMSWSARDSLQDQILWRIHEMWEMIDSTVTSDFCFIDVKEDDQE